MRRLVLNKPDNFESAVRAVVKQSFPFASPTTMALEASDKGLRGGGVEVTTRKPGTTKERFVWGTSLMGSSRIVG